MIDSKSEPHLSEAHQDGHSPVNFVAPRSELELALSRMWADVLAVERVGVYDDFFDVGGHSQLLIRVQLKLTELLKIDVPVTALFEYRTIDSLAKYLDSMKASG